MRTKSYSLIILLAAIFTILLGMLTSCSLPPNNPEQINTSSGGRDAQTVSIEVITDGGDLVSATTETVAAQATPRVEGLSLLESHCTHCHTVQSLRQIRKERTEWEKSLAQMEAMGVRLGDGEKNMLLDYLTGSQK